MEKYLDVFVKEFYSPFHAVRDTDPRTEHVWAWITKAQDYRTYMHSACQFGSRVPRFWVLRSTEYSVPCTAATVMINLIVQQQLPINTITFCL